jgi:hypothetical protein
MEESQLHAPDVISLGKIPTAHCTEVWVSSGLEAVVETKEKLSLFRKQNPGHPGRSYSPQ